MNPLIKKHPVQHPLLQNFIKFFWELQIDHTELNHRIIPQRNINLRFNLNDTQQYAVVNGIDQKLDDVYFTGLQDKFSNIQLKLNGKVDVLGICFFPEGFYPIIKIPVNEFRNQIICSNEINFFITENLSNRLKESHDIKTRLIILENELIKLIINGEKTPENFRRIFNILKKSETPLQISEFCKSNKISLRSLERMYNKYVGISANTYYTLNRFHVSMNQLLNTDYQKLSDLAFDNGYFDQMHFIRDFKRFTGNSPRNFIQDKNSILQIGKFS